LWDASSKTGGPLPGDSMVRRAATQIRQALVDPLGSIAEGQLPALIGIEITKTGSIKFDEAKFNAALANDREGTMRVLTGDDGTGGVVARVAGLAATTGSVGSQLKST